MKTYLFKIILSFFILFGFTNIMASQTKVDIIFVMDTSGSLSDEADALKSSIVTIKQDLSSIYDFNSKLWSITDEFDFSSSGFDSSVIKEIPNTTSNHYEDWGPATYDIATFYNKWRKDSVKIVVPISDEGPENGNGLYQDDADVIKKARLALDKTNIFAIPIIGQGSRQDTIYKDYALILSSKALKTNSGDLVSQFKQIVSDIVAEATGKTLGSISHVYKEKFGGGKLFINAKGAKKYKVDVKFDGTNIFSNTTNSDVISFQYPQNYDKTKPHKLSISYVVYALDTNGKTLEEKTNSFEHTTTLEENKVQNDYPKLITQTVAPDKIYTSGSFLEKTGAGQVVNNESAFNPYETNYIADPVDISSGNFEFSHDDLIIQTAGVPLVINRLYNSLEKIRGWKFSISSTMDLSDIENIKVSWQDSNSQDLFVKSKDGWSSIYSTDKLDTEAGFYVITKTNGLKYKFNTSGKLSSVTNTQNLGFTLEHSNNQIIAKDTFGNLLATIYLDNFKIIKITDVAGNNIIYKYDGDNIISYTNRNDNVEKYEYMNGLLYKIIGSDNNAYVKNIYDAQGRVISQQDAKGNETKFLYTGELDKFIVSSAEVTYPNGVSKTHKFNLLMPQSIDMQGIKVSFKYDSNNKVTSITDTNNKTTLYERNNKGLVTKVTNSADHSSSYSYDDRNNLIQTTNALNQKSSYEYDKNNNLVKTTDNQNNSISYEYNSDGLISKIIDNENNEYLYSYNAKKQLQTLTMPNGAKTTYKYNLLGQVKSVTNALNQTTSYEYDKEGQLVKTINPIGDITTMEYNGYGDLIKVTDPSNKVVQMEYNTDGLLTKTTLPNLNTIEQKYDVLGRVIEQKDVLGRVTKKEYDDFGRVSKIIDAKNKEYILAYDNVGNLVKVTDAKGNEAKIEYDELYRPSKKIDAKGNTIQTISYNKLSIPTKIENAQNKTMQFKYDSLNRLTKSALSNFIEAKTIYDKQGRISQIIDPKNMATKYEYDKMGNLLKETNPINQSNSYTYNLLGMTTKILNANGVETAFKYDKLNRIVKIINKKDDTNETFKYEYDKASNIISIKKDDEKVSFTYDINNQVTTRTDIYGNKIGYEYDKMGRLSKLIYPNNKEVVYSYDENDNLINVTDFNKNQTTFAYDKNDNLIKTIHANSSYTLYNYDENNHLISLKNYNNKSELISSNELTRDSIGNIIGHDEQNLAKVDLSNIKNFEFEVNEFNQITKSADNNFTYDKNGNLLKFTLDKPSSFKYSLSDKLIKANVSENTFTYKYDPLGNRVSINDTRYIVDDVLGLSKPLAKLDSNGNINTYYIYTNGLAYSLNENGEMLVYLYDYKGNTSTILDKNNQAKASYRYSGYGKLISKKESLENPFKFLGKYAIQSDSDELYYVRARYYSPTLNRWLSADAKRGTATNPLSLNRYVLNEGDVVNYVDVSGYNRENTKSYNSYFNILGNTAAATELSANIYAISNVPSRAPGAIKAMATNSFFSAGDVSTILQGKRGFTGISVKNLSATKTSLSISQTAGSVALGFAMVPEAIKSGNEIGKSFALDKSKLTIAAKTSASTAGLGIRTLGKIPTGTARLGNLALTSKYSPPINPLLPPAVDSMVKIYIKKNIDRTLDSIDNQIDETFSGDNIYNNLKKGTNVAIGGVQTAIDAIKNFEIIPAVH